ncbi:MAG: hypothetical protein JRJ57_00645 [Deltaproteobacteria bacterium]|nr:hypothetical protein [Deltaproteobacteria bacterium]
MKNRVTKIITVFLNGQAIIKVNKGLGHDFSEDFSEHLEKNLQWVIKQVN